MWIPEGRLVLVVASHRNNRHKPKGRRDCLNIRKHIFTQRMMEYRLLKQAVNSLSREILQIKPRATGFGSSYLTRGVGPNDFHRTLPNSTIMKFCNSVTHSLQFLSQLHGLGSQFPLIYSRNMLQLWEMLWKISPISMLDQHWHLYFFFFNLVSNALRILHFQTFAQSFFMCPLLCIWSCSFEGLLFYKIACGCFLMSQTSSLLT